MAVAQAPRTPEHDDDALARDEIECSPPIWNLAGQGGCPNPSANEGTDVVPWLGQPA
jgi:hypothetical protein